MLGGSTCGMRSPKEGPTTEKKITIVSPSIEGAKKWAGLCQRPVNSRCFDIGENAGLTNTAIGFCRGVPTVSRAAKGGETFSGMMT